MRALTGVVVDELELVLPLRDDLLQLPIVQRLLQLHRLFYIVSRGVWT